MNATTRHSLVQAAVLSADSVIQKTANYTPEQQEVLNQNWPTNEDAPTVALAKVIAQGLTVTEE